MSEILKIINLSYKYQDGKREKIILDNLSMGFESGKFYALIGESGSGKTTFLSLLAGLDKPQSGSILFKDRDINDIGLNNYRKKNISLIFQDYNLIPYMNVYDNLASAIAISSSNKDKKDITSILKQLSLSEDILPQRASKLSGGEKQRVAIARSILTNSDVILADEPTGNLDHITSMEIIDIFKELVAKYNKTIIMVTHNVNLIKKVDYSYYLDQNLKRFVAYEN